MSKHNQKQEREGAKRFRARMKRKQAIATVHMIGDTQHANSTRGSILIRAALDGPFEPILKVKAIVPNPSRTVIDSITSGRPSTANRQQSIKDLIHQMQTLKPSLAFQQARNILQRERPELFD